MSKDDKLRRQIAFEAARLIFFRQEHEFIRAKWKAGRRMGHGWVKPGDLPSNREVREQMLLLARIQEGHHRDENLRDMRVDALRMMRQLRRFRPRLTGSVLSGHAQRASRIEIHVFTDRETDVTSILDGEGFPYRVEHQQVSRRGRSRRSTRVHVEDHYPIELTFYPEASLPKDHRGSISAKPAERASIREVEELLSRDYPGFTLDEALSETEPRGDRFRRYESLLLPLEDVKQNPMRHPEGDALYHSLQVFLLACERHCYDEEFLLAALLHDVGQAIDRLDHVRAGLEALEGWITPRTTWLIRHQTEGAALRDRALGARSRRRLEQAESFEELMDLVDCDRQGRLQGVVVPDVGEALDYVRELGERCDA